MKFSLETALIHPHTKRHGYRALACPIYQTSTYENRFMSPGVYSYTRVSNPTRHELEAVAGAAEGGRYASAFSSGLAVYLPAVIYTAAHTVCFPTCRKSAA